MTIACKPCQITTSGNYYMEKKGSVFYMLVQDVSQLIGNTPTLKANRFEKANGIEANVYLKLEYFNPGGSVKDRIGLSMIKTAEQAGIIGNGGTIIEATSGNTGIALAYLSSILGYKCIIVMPDTMSVERQKTMKAYGAELVLTPGKDGMKGALKKASELVMTTENAFSPLQFENPSNPQAHRITTAFELLSDVPNIDIFIAGVGTGGTITGVGEELKKHNPNLKVIAVEPSTSPVLSGGEPGPHGIQGIGAGMIPKVLNMDVIDEVITVTTEESKAQAKEFAKTEGLMVGISSGAALAAAIKVGKRPENKLKNIAVILPDTGLRYLSTDTFN